MGKIEYKIEFPCGYKMDLKAESMFLGELEVPDVCPLHGKVCSYHIRTIKQPEPEEEVEK